MTFADAARDQAALATGLMGWAPDVFWAATPVEWQVAWRLWARAHGLAPGGGALNQTSLAALLDRFPDGAS